MAASHAGLNLQTGILRHSRSLNPHTCAHLSSSRTTFTALKRLPLQRTAAVEAPSAPAVETSTSSGHSSPEELRAHLIKKGWQRAWLDGIQERQAKGEFTTTVDSAEQLISFLEGLGIPSQSVCNMASMVPKILGVQESAAKEVADYLKGKGLTGGEIASALQRHPKLLTFSMSGQGLLENGRMRAEAGKDDAGRVYINMFREGAFRKTPK